MNNLPSNINASTCDVANIGSTQPINRSLPRFNIAFVCALLLFVFGNLSSQAQASREYQLKAVFLYNFAQFTDWPTDAFAGDKSPIVIGVLGGDPFGQALNDTVRGETVRGHPLLVEHYRHADEIKTCHILFISQVEIRHWDDIVKATKGKPVLTVADADGAVSAKAVIRFAVANNKVHFRINQDAAREENLTLSSKLLRVADVVPPEKTP
jgi:YfiR/HmsC-like